MNVGVWMAFVAAMASASSDFQFGYDGEKGPDHWADLFGTCAGKYQSPINIEEHFVQTVQLTPLIFAGFDITPKSSKLTNNGHTVKLEVDTATATATQLSGGPLKAGYTFSQMHFHWGYNDSFGSEDLINNHSFPMELHVVCFKSEYSNDTEAGMHDDGIAVMAFFFQVIEADNEEYAEIVTKLSQVIDQDQSVELTEQWPLSALMGGDRTHYYTYHGSLTTPPCSEVVTWIDFTQPILLSHNQLEAFRQLRNNDGLMTHNNRPTQPLGGRLVWYNERQRDQGDESGRDGSGAACHFPLLSLTLATIAATVLVKAM